MDGPVTIGGSRRPSIDDEWLFHTLVGGLGNRLDAFRSEGDGDPLCDLEAYESILYSLEKQDLILIVKLVQTLATTVSPKQALHTLVRRLTEVLPVSHCSLIFLDLEARIGTVAISHEDPDFLGVRISLDRYPEIQRSLKTGEITIVKNPTQDPLMGSLQKDQIRKIMDVSIMVLPLAFQARVFGTLLVRKQRSEEGFFIREVRICQLMVHVVLRVLQRMCRAVRAPRAAGEDPERASRAGEAGPPDDDVLDSMLVSSAPVGVLVLDGQGCIVRANPRASEILSRPQEDLLRMRYNQIVPDAWIEKIRRMRKRPDGAGDEVNRYHVSYTTPDGLERVLSVEHDPFPGREPLTWVFFRDASTEKQMEERLENQRRQLQETNERLLETRSELLRRCEDLRQSNERLEELDKIKTHFLAVATHEIRTPLSVIIGYNNFLLQERAGKVPARQRKILQESVESGERLLGIVNEMLEFSRIESGRLELRPKESDVRQLLERVHRQMKIMADRAKLEFRLQVGDLPGAFPHDPDRIEQVLVNLISNAIKFTQERGSITLAARPVLERGVECLEVSVRDNGRGISQAMIGKLFAEGPPLLADAQVPAQEKGVGLGLAISRRIIEAHRGRIWAESREGEGATFTFRIPCRPDVEARLDAGGGSA